MTDEKLNKLTMIVEGHGEHQSYNSLASRILKERHEYIPIGNVSGIGNILKEEKFHANLTQFTKMYNPRVVLVTLDLIDAVKRGYCSDCVELKNKMDTSIQIWTSNAAKDGRIIHVPNVTVIIQIQKLETWLLADLDSLKESGWLKESAPLHDDVDSLKDPSDYIRTHAARHIDTKNPKTVKDIFTNMDVDVMRTKSGSFDKFARELEKIY